MNIYKGGERKKKKKEITKKVPGVRVNKSLMVLKGYPKFAENQKYIISLEFSSK
jgi:hypothetical protein